MYDVLICVNSQLNNKMLALNAKRERGETLSQQTDNIDDKPDGLTRCH